MRRFFQHNQGLFWACFDRRISERTVHFMHNWRFFNDFSIENEDSSVENWECCSTTSRGRCGSRARRAVSPTRRRGCGAQVQRWASTRTRWVQKTSVCMKDDLQLVFCWKMRSFHLKMRNLPGAAPGWFCRKRACGAAGKWSHSFPNRKWRLCHWKIKIIPLKNEYLGRPGGGCRQRYGGLAAWGAVIDAMATCNNVFHLTPRFREMAPTGHYFNRTGA